MKSYQSQYRNSHGNPVSTNFPFFFFLSLSSRYTLKSIGAWSFEPIVLRIASVAVVAEGKSLTSDEHSSQPTVEG
jgi:hypothetical protein